MLHTFPESLAYDRKLQDTDLTVLFSLENVLRALAENCSALRVASNAGTVFFERPSF